MGKKQYYYAWKCIGDAGVEDNWEDCRVACTGKPGEKHKKFNSREEAEAFAFSSNESEKECDSVCDDTLIQDKVEDISINVESGGVLPSATAHPTHAVNEYCREYGYSGLSDIQKCAVQSVDGKTLLFAVPGSGKTTVLIARLGFMIYSCNISPESIVSLTYTKAAALEMKERFCSRFDTENSPEFRTIHSLCYSIILPMLKNSGYSYPPNLVGQEIEEKGKYNKYSINNIYHQLFSEMRFSSENFETAMESVQSVISWIKNSDRTIESFGKNEIIINGKRTAVVSLYECYQKILMKLNCMDYDDLIIYAYNGLKSNIDVLNELRNKYRYWCIDEAQDNSPIQSSLLSLICNEGISLFMVGDDDQSIYSFRGAKPSLLKDFGRKSGVKVLKMNVNYRSDASIVSVCRSFIEKNSKRETKDMISNSQKNGEIAIPHIFNTEVEQYQYIIRAAEQAKENKESLAIIYRRNISGLPLALYLNDSGFSYEICKSIKDLMKEKLVSELFAFLKFVNDPCNIDFFFAAKKIGICLKTEVETKLKEKCKNGKNYDVLRNLYDIYDELRDEKHKEEVHNIIRFINNLKGCTPLEVINSYIKEYQILATTVGDRLRLYSLASACNLFTTINDFLQTICSIVEKEKRLKTADLPVDNDESIDAVATDTDSFITLSTMHSAKGREFDRVIVVDTFDEIMPGKERKDSLFYDPEEERRLFYVAMTRAIHRLDILMVNKYHSQAENVSRFINEVDLLSSTLSGYLEQKIDIGSNKIKSHPLKLVRKYYAVKAGRIPGIYSTFEECKEQVYKYSGADYRVFDNVDEAKDYIGETRKELEYGRLKEIVIESAGTVFNFPVDIPNIITETIHRHFGVSELTEIDLEKLGKIRDQSRIYGNNKITDYSDRTEAYMLAYLPVNYFKSWKPMTMLLQEGKLSTCCRILELGTGPGTTALSLLEFYSLLAECNQGTLFDIEIVSVEKEEKFKVLYENLVGSFMESVPKNLSIKSKFLCADAFYLDLNGEYFDIVIESNMMNSEELLNEETVANFLKVVERASAACGNIIMIEPGKIENKHQLQEIARKALDRKMFALHGDVIMQKIDTSAITLFNEALDAGIRYKKNPEHWFSCMIMRKE